jgi:hypothetical protein
MDKPNRAIANNNAKASDTANPTKPGDRNTSVGWKALLAQSGGALLPCIHSPAWGFHPKAGGMGLGGAAPPGSCQRIRPARLESSCA